MQQQQLPPPVLQKPYPVLQQLPPAAQRQEPPAAKRRGGLSLASNEVASVPKAQMQLDMDWSAERTLDREELTEALQKTFGPRARIQLDEVADKSSALSRTFQG